ncbi:unnamed protein product [Rhodiola kirilowii]
MVLLMALSASLLYSGYAMLTSLCHEPRLRLKACFGSLYRCLARGARAAFQIYPEASPPASLHLLNDTTNKM